MQIDLTDRTALVTGSTAGIGPSPPMDGGVARGVA